MNKTLFSTGKNDWETPQELFDLLGRDYRFTLDACATRANAKCARFFSPEEDGLTQDWGGETVWCNPPYSAKQQDAFVKKMFRGKPKAWNDGSGSAPGAYRYEPVPPIHLWPGRDPLCMGPHHLRWRGTPCALPEYARDMALQGGV